MPAIEEVLTMWPPSPCARISGVTILTPFTTPPRLTRRARSQASKSGSCVSPPPPMPALLHSTWILPKRRVHRFAQPGAVAHVSLQKQDVVASRELGLFLLQVIPIEVDRSDLHVEGEKVLHQPVADAARAARHERDPAGEVLHGVSVP